MALSLICLTVPAPWVNQLEGQRKVGFYPGMVSNILESTGQSYLDPFEDFATELLRLTAQLRREGKPTSPNPLCNQNPGQVWPTRPKPVAMAPTRSIASSKVRPRCVCGMAKSLRRVATEAHELRDSGSMDQTLRPFSSTRIMLLVLGSNPSGKRVL